MCIRDRALDFIKFVSPGFVLTKGLPGCITAATIKTLELMQTMPERRQQLWENVNVLRNGLRDAGFEIGNPQGAVTSIFTRGAMALSVVRMLMDEHGIIVNPVMYPAVPYGTSIIRMTASALHTPQDMQRLVNAILEVSKVLPLHEVNQAALSKVATPESSNASATPSQNGSTH